MSSPVSLLPMPGSAIQVAWNPDGERVAVALAPSPLVDDRYMFQRIHIVGLADGEILATVDREGKLGRMEWSPDGTLLAMISAADLHDPSASSLLVAPSLGLDAGNVVDVDVEFSGAPGGSWQKTDAPIQLLSDPAE